MSIFIGSQCICCAFFLGENYHIEYYLNKNKEESLLALSKINFLKLDVFDGILRIFDRTVLSHEQGLEAGND